MNSSDQTTCLDPYFASFEESLASKNYKPWTLKNYRCLLRRFGGLMEARGNYTVQGHMTETPNGRLQRFPAAFARAKGQWPQRGKPRHPSRWHLTPLVGTGPRIAHLSWHKRIESRAAGARHCSDGMVTAQSNPEINSRPPLNSIVETSKSSPTGSQRKRPMRLCPGASSTGGLAVNLAVGSTHVLIHLSPPKSLSDGAVSTIMPPSVLPPTAF